MFARTGASVCTAGARGSLCFEEGGLRLVCVISQLFFALTDEDLTCK